jgi:hypothetical protein
MLDVFKGSPASLIYIERLRVLAKEKSSQIVSFYKDKFGNEDTQSVVSGGGNITSRSTAAQRASVRPSASKEQYQQKLKEIEDSKREKEFLKKRTQALVQALTKSSDKIEILNKNKGQVSIEPNYIQKPEIIMDDIHSEIDRASAFSGIPSSLSSALSNTTQGNNDNLYL